MQTNEDIVRQLLTAIPREFYGTIELNFHRGTLMWAKTSTTQKFNPERTTAEATNELHRH
jgi:hypothetical protein